MTTGSDRIGVVTVPHPVDMIEDIERFRRDHQQYGYEKMTGFCYKPNFVHDFHIHDDQYALVLYGEYTLKIKGPIVSGSNSPRYWRWGVEWGTDGTELKAGEEVMLTVGDRAYVHRGQCHEETGGSQGAAVLISARGPMG
ncbi:MAG: hypothetical protein VYA69_13635 [Gemmatimonadota bacterium]|nr:hypothetical protein [Gemmatimonadota bacterium]